MVDELGEVMEQLHHFKSREEELKEAIKQNGAGIYAGRIFTATLYPRSITTLSKELLVKNVDPKILKKCEKVTPYLKVEMLRRNLLKN
jgi:hypothetical protein